MATCIAINLKTGKAREFVGILDTGADESSLTPDIFESLGIDPDDLPGISVGVGFADFNSVHCDFISIGFTERGTMKEYFPNKDKVVPVHMTEYPFSLLGRQMFLDLCDVCFYGPAQSAIISF